MDPETLRRELKNPDYDYNEISLQDVTPGYVLGELKTLERWFKGTKQEKEYNIRFVRLKRRLWFEK